MQEKDLFEYAVIRVVPRVEREEFLNVGVILFCSKQKFLKALCKLDEQKITAVYGSSLDVMEIEDIEENLNSFVKIAEGGEGAGPIGKLDMPSRFRWLTATRSTVLQTSKVHPGFCEDPQQTLERLFDQLVV
jgi:hypothetical protein